MDPPPRPGRPALAHLLVFYGFLALFAGTADPGRPGRRRRAAGRALLAGRLLPGLLADAGPGRPGTASRAGRVRASGAAWCARPGSTTAAGGSRAPSRRSRGGTWSGTGCSSRLLGFLVVTGFALEALRIADTDPVVRALVAGRLDARARPVRGRHVSGDGRLRSPRRCGGSTASSRSASWPRSRSPRRCTCSPRRSGVTVREPRRGTTRWSDPGRRRARAWSATAAIADLSWRHLADLDACTKCGRCHAACPATACGYPLSPRDLVLDLRELAEGSLGIRAQLGLEPLHDPADAIVGTAVAPETVWSCMSCMACVEICPVGIEHVPIINQLRRRLVDQGELEPLLQTDARVRPRTGQLARRAAPQARALDAGSRLRGQGHPPAAGRVAVVRR